jgi:hypothetical protein
MVKITLLPEWLPSLVEGYEILQMLVRIFNQTSSKIQLSDQGYEIRADLKPLNIDRV